MRIRKAVMSDLSQIMALYQDARQFMRETGNPNQWKDTYPEEWVVKKGIQEGKAYVALAEGPEDVKRGEETAPGEMLGAFYFAQEEDPTYVRIYNGEWLNPEPYGVVHRLAGVRKARGFSESCFTWVGRQCRNLKIDTHQENRVMQHVLEKNGFVQCGTIYLENGEERLAYQRWEGGQTGKEQGENKSAET